MEDKLSREEIFAEAKRIVPLVYDEKDLIKFDIDNYKKYIDKKYKLFSIDIELLLVGLCGMKYDGEDWLNDKIDMKKSIKHHQEVLDYDKKEFGANVEGRYTTYTGYLKCNECNCNLRKFTRPNSNNNFYYCNTYVKNKNCNKHYILESELDDIVLNSINNFIDLVCNVQDRIEEVVSYSKIDYNDELKKLKLIEIDKKIKRVELMLEELVKDYKCDIISEDDYDSFKQKYIMEKNSLNLEKEELNKSKINSYNLNWINNFKKMEHIETIDRNIVDSLIENIFVNDDKTVEIQFKFKNHYEDALRYLKIQDNVI